VTGGKPIAVLLQSISGVSAINSLVAFYNVHGGKKEALFFYFVPDTARYLYVYNMHNIEQKHISINIAPVRSRGGSLSSSLSDYSPLLDIGLSYFSPSRSILGYSHPASRPAQIFFLPLSHTKRGRYNMFFIML
jgi:hypothetical protein